MLKINPPSVNIHFNANLLCMSAVCACVRMCVCVCVCMCVYVYACVCLYDSHQNFMS